MGEKQEKPKRLADCLLPNIHSLIAERKLNVRNTSRLVDTRHIIIQHLLIDKPATSFFPNSCKNSAFCLDLGMRTEIKMHLRVLYVGLKAQNCLEPNKKCKSKENNQTCILLIFFCISFEKWLALFSKKRREI